MAENNISQSLDEEEIIDDYEEDEDIIPEKYSIASYGADYVVDMLVKRLLDDDIYIPPFQREFIWNIKQSSRFIESLLLGLPVPGIFLSKDDESKKLLVIDGQQRLRTLKYFYDGVFGDTKKIFSLVRVQKYLEGKTYKTLSDEERRQLNDSIIHATIIKQDKPSDDNTSVHYIFERLNTSGTPLTHQEIRATIYIGEFNNLLGKLNQDENWRFMYGNISKRRRDQEFILRFFALLFEIDKYSLPMKNFLDKFMRKNRHLNIYSEKQLTHIFSKTIKCIRENIGRKAFRPVKAFNAAIYDAVMVGIAKRIAFGKITQGEQIKANYDELLKKDAFLKAIETGTTSQVSSVTDRIDLAITSFKNIS